MYSWTRPGFWAFLIVTLILITGAAFAADSQGYYRWPTVYGDRVVFTSEGDLWEAPLAGGVARRLTTAAGVESFAMYSPDGKWIAFTGNYDGNIDVYVMPAGGGEPKRLTYHPGPDVLAAWTPKGTVVFRSMMETPGRIWKCYEVSPDGGFPVTAPVDEAAHITYEPNGDRIAYTRVSLGNHRWKRYKGGWAEQIIVGSTRTHDYKQVTTWEGNNSIPLWYKDRVYYLRDNDARMNIHSMKPDGSDIKQHTNHTDWDCRWPSLSQGKIAYMLGADIWVYDIDKNEDHKIDIQLPSDRAQAREKFVQPSEFTSDFSLSPDGKRLLLGARGELFTAPTERRGILHQITRNAGAREKFPIYLPKGDSILTWSDLTGEEELYVYPAKGTGEPRKLGKGAGNYNFQVEISPDGKWGVYGDNNRKLQLLDLKTNRTTQIDTSAWEIRNYAWSPDSRYVAYTVSLANDQAGVRIFDTQDKSVHPVTDEMWNSFGPSWDPKGKWLYFTSSRWINPHGSWNDWSFIVEEPDKIYALALDPETKSPYAYNEDGTKADDEKKDKDKEKKEDGDKKDKNKDKEKKEEKVVVKIVWDGLPDRIIELPVDAGNLGGLEAIEGKLYYVSAPNTGWNEPDVGEEDHGPKATLHLFDIKKTKDSEVVHGVQGYALSLDLKKLVVKKKDGFVVMDAGADKEPEAEKDDKEAGLHLDEWIYDVDPRFEWKQIFNEAWRLQRDFFYDPNMHGINWKEQHDHYGSLLTRINTRDELNDVIAQMIAELDAGHTYVGGGDVQSGKTIGVGLLGIDVTRTSDGFYKIDRILTADRWDKDRTSPLAAPGLGVKAGDYLVAIDRIPVSSVKNYLELLNNKAGKLVIVSFNSKASLDGAKEAVVKTMSSEGELRYWDWVYGRADYVKKHGGDDIGYVHLSDMGRDGMMQWMREYYPQSKKKTMIVDVRYNGGGNIAEWILTQLQHSVWSWGRARNGSTYTRPPRAFYGHLIALCNEETGSDGETFSEGWKRLKFGPLVGKRTWGGWVGIRGDKPFVDHGFFTQPEFTGWGKESKWLIEGPGVYPDVVVDNHPKQMLEGVDEQLDYAIDYLKKEMKDEPMNPPAQPPYPNKAPKYGGK